MLAKYGKVELAQPSRQEPLVAVLLGTKDGAAFLDEQLQSIHAQDHSRIDLWASDDASCDGTLEILDRWASKWSKGRFVVLPGPCRGFAENYRSLILNENIDADYFAFCDQDDIWEPNRLSAGLGYMGARGTELAQMFCSRTLTIAEDGKVVGASPLFVRPPSFGNALVQSIAGANTMAFNSSARKLLMTASRRASFVSHDWWTYMILTGAGASVHYTVEPLVRYRQHAHNAVGQNRSLLARIDRFRRLFSGAFFDWTTENLHGLAVNRDLLTPDALASLQLFSNARKGNMIQRVKRLRASGVHRQNSSHTFAMTIAAMLGKL
jgi:glycosyltransferase involved in cell wall biosynthesis